MGLHATQKLDWRGHTLNELFYHHIWRPALRRKLETTVDNTRRGLVMSGPITERISLLHRFIVRVKWGSLWPALWAIEWTIDMKAYDKSIVNSQCFPFNMDLFLMFKYLEIWHFFKKIYIFWVSWKKSETLAKWFDLPKDQPRSSCLVWRGICSAVCHRLPQSLLSVPTSSLVSVMSPWGSLRMQLLVCENENVCISSCGSPEIRLTS